MKSNIIITTILFLLVLAFTFFYFSPNKAEDSSINNEQSSQEFIYFYGDGCPACPSVTNYIDQNRIQDKISLAKKEIYNNQNNAQLLREKAEICNLDHIAVPFLWNGEDCFIGFNGIINALEQEINE